VTGGNGYGLEIFGTTTLSGNLFVNSNTNFILGTIDDGGSGMFINKIDTGTLWINSPTNSVSGGIYVNAGMLRFGNPLAGDPVVQAGTGMLTINPGSEIRLEGPTLANINTVAGQKVDLVGAAYAAAVFRTPAVTQAEYQDALTSTSDGQLALLSNQNNVLGSRHHRRGPACIRARWKTTAR